MQGVLHRHRPLGPRLRPAPGPVSTRPLRAFLSVCLSSGTTAGWAERPRTRDSPGCFLHSGKQRPRAQALVVPGSRANRQGPPGRQGQAAHFLQGLWLLQRRLQGASSQQGGRTRCSESDATTSPSGKLCPCLRAQPHLHAPQTPRRQLRAYTSSLCPSRLPDMQTKPVSEARGWESASPEAPVPPIASCQRCLQAVPPASCPRPGQGPPCPLAWTTQKPPSWEHTARSNPTSYP